MLGQRHEAEQTVRTLFDRRKDKSNMSHAHSISGLLYEQGKYSEAEELETKVKNWLDVRLGKDSPQALGSRRIIARSIWNQGRESEARSIFSEVFSLIENMGEGEYVVYKSEQLDVTKKLLLELEAWSRSSQQST
jgi:hypothetical protein